jgi:hypothetical protein
MRRNSFLFFLVMLILLTLACAAVDMMTPTPVMTPTEFPVIIPHPMQTARPAPTNTPTFAPVIFTPASFPAWVADFSNPIFVALEGQRPDFQDDFPPVCIDKHKAWKICATPERRLNYQYPLSSLVTAVPRPTLDLQPDLQRGYALLNTGWFFIVPESRKNPFYAHIDSGVLVLKLPEGKEYKDLWVYNPHLMAENFVLQFDLEFGESQPQDAFKFQFEQAGGERFALELVKNKTWAFHWGSGETAESRAGAYEYFSAAQVRVLIVARGNQCAVYLNNVPLDYFENCRSDANQKITPKSATFHILGRPGYSSMIMIDNVQMWDLDKIP